VYDGKATLENMAGGPQPRGVHRLLSAAYEAADQAVKGVAELRTVSTYAAASATAMS